MTESFENIVRLPPPHTARSYSELTPVYKADEVAKTIASFEAELAKANERVKELEQDVLEEIENRDSREEWLDKLSSEISRYFCVDIGEHSSANNPWLKAFEAIPEGTLNKFTIEQQIEALAHVLSSYKTQKFCPTNYAIQAFNDGVAHLWAHIVNCELQLRKEQDK